MTSPRDGMGAMNWRRGCSTRSFGEHFAEREPAGPSVIMHISGASHTVAKDAIPYSTIDAAAKVFLDGEPLTGH